jgi:hypothetical protein
MSGSLKPVRFAGLLVLILDRIAREEQVAFDLPKLDMETVER